jgi:hypothetical protein
MVQRAHVEEKAVTMGSQYLQAYPWNSVVLEFVAVVAAAQCYVWN